ncbi:hypothetical protein Ahy_A05g022118 [Arachis hypogaea]|uniref:Transposase MuDR plant domain-containing protein n=1 Tax=Arachis hypogaea TaxID=3818 RepID=A0A445CZQ4_ARAHY|nr:hypothetical protein Ahy_A05g022118 [Arachis hypogaea]
MVEENHNEEGDGNLRQSERRKRHSRPQPSGQRIIPPRDNEVPTVIVPIHEGNADGVDKGGENEFQYESEDLHSLPESDDENGVSVFPQHNPEARFGQVRLELGIEFATMQEFKDVVKKYNIQMGREVFFLKVEPLRCRVICYNQECLWEVYCSRRNFPPSFQIKTLVDEHTCPRSNKSRSVTCKWVAGELVNKLRITPNLIQREAEEWFKVEYDISVGERMIYRAMEMAKDIIEGTEKEQYGKLRNYLSELLKANLGSTCTMSTHPQPEGLPKFRSLYICLEACKRGFKHGCRPFICLDGTFLKGYFGGQLLTTLGQDANNHLFPIAYVVVDAETKENWKWFLHLLHKDIGDYKEFGWNFMSDKQKVIFKSCPTYLFIFMHLCCSIEC